MNTDNNTDNSIVADNDVLDDPPTTTTTFRRQERCHSFVRRSFSEEFAPPAEQGQGPGQSNRHVANNHSGGGGGGERNAYWGYDHGNRPPSWTQQQQQPPPNHQTYASGGGAPWGYNPNINSPHSQHHHYYRHYYAPPPPPSSPSEPNNYEHQRPAFNWPSESASANIFDDPLPFRPDSRAGFLPPLPRSHSRDADSRDYARDADTPTRSNRGGGRYHHSHHHHQHQYHHPFGEIQRQFSWEDWEYSQPPLPRRESIPPQGLQRLHHHHRENDILDIFSRTTTGGSNSNNSRQSPSPPEASNVTSNDDDDHDDDHRNSSRLLVVEEAATAPTTTTSPPTTTYSSDCLIRGIRTYDVLCGRGIQQAREHHGNLAFRDLVRSKQVDYLASIRNNKAKIAMSIMDQTRRRGGRFLKKSKVRKYEAVGGDAWEEMKEKQVYDKVCQALREGAPRIREHMMMAMSKSSRSTDDNKSSSADKENSVNHRSAIL
jgi:hypothetical protein